MRGDFRIGEWLVQPQLNAMQRQDEKIRLEPKVMQVLVQLAACHGEVLSKAKLIESVWPDTFVGEHVLTRCISELRHILHEDPREPQYIQNVPRVGYRLMVPTLPAETAEPVSPAGSELHEIAIPPAKSSDNKTNAPAATRQYPLYLIASIAVLGAVLATAGSLILHRRATPAGPSVRTLPLTSYPGLQSQPSFSPDGNQAAFVWNQHGDVSNIYVKLLNSETPLQITSGDGQDQSPAWSPDGSQIAFIRYANGKETACLVSALGGPERILYELHRTIDWDAPGLSWSPDGNWLIFPDAQSVDDPSAIYTLSLKTGEARPLTAPPNPSDGDYNPVFSPNGQRIAFIRGTDAAARNLFMMNSDGTGLGQLTFNARTIAGIAWTPDGSALVFSSDIGGSLALWKVASSGGSPERLTVGGDNAMSPALSRRGDRLAYSQGSTEWNTMRLDLAAPAHKPMRLFSSTEKDSAVQYSPDSNLIVFQSMRSGTQEIWTSQPDGTKPVRLTSFDGPFTGSPNWSPDGQQIAFDSRSGGWSHIFVMSAEGRKPHPLTTGDYNDVIPSWSADGKWIYFASRRSGRWEVWKSNPQTKQMQQVTVTGGFVARESPDGQWLYYTKYHHQGLWRRPAASGQETQVLARPPSEYWGYWCLTSTGIYYLNIQKTRVTLEFWRASDAHVSVILVLDRKPPPFSGIAVSPDNRWLVYSDAGNMAQNIRLVENFR